MRRSIALAATLAMLGLAPALALAQQTTPPVPAQTSPRLMPRGPGTPNSTTAPATPGTMSMSRRPMAQPAPSQSAPSGQLVNINRASPSELDALPQIGKARLKKIIDNRPYTSTQDLVTKHVLSQHVYDTIKDRITTR